MTKSIINQKIGSEGVFHLKNGLSIVHLQSFVLPKDIQIIPIQVNLKNCKWLICSVYRPPTLDLTNFLQSLTDVIDFYSFERYIIIGDINSDPKFGKLAEAATETVFENICSFFPGATFL